MGKRFSFYFLVFVSLSSLIGCASAGPSVIKIYDDVAERDMAAVILTPQMSRGLI